MSGRKGTKHLREEDFNQIKALQAHGVSNKYLAEITKRSYGTVNTVSRFETFADYKAWQKERFAKLKEKAEEKPLRRDEFQEIQQKQQDQLTIGAITNHRGTIYGLGHDNRVYVWTDAEWRVYT